MLAIGKRCNLQAPEDKTERRFRGCNLVIEPHTATWLGAYIKKKKKKSVFVPGTNDSDSMAGVGRKLTAECRNRNEE